MGRVAYRGGYCVPSRHTLPAVHSGQIVAAQAAALVWLAGGGHPAAAGAAAVLLAAAFGRVRGRWLHEWARLVTGLAVRRWRTTPDAGAMSTLARVRPGIRAVEVALDRPAAGLDDGYGTVVLLDLDDAGVDGQPLVVPALPDLPVQLVVSTRAAAGGPATVDTRGVGRPAAAGTGPPLLRQVLLAVRIPPGGDAAGWVRAVTGRLAPLQARPVPPGELTAVLEDLVGSGPVHESWSALHAGGLRQVTYRVGRDPTGPGAPVVVPFTTTAALATASPGGAGTPVTTTVGLCGRELTVRVAAAPGLRAPAPAAGRALRLDGQHLPGLAATLPLAVGPPHPAAPGLGVAVPVHVPAAGLVLGHDADGAPVTVALFGRGGTRVVLIGGVGEAVGLAGLALTAGVDVEVVTSRPAVWAPLAAGGGAGGGVRDGGTPGAAVPDGGVAGGAVPDGAAAGRLRLVPEPASGPAGGTPHRPVLSLVDSDRGFLPAPRRWTAEVLVRQRLDGGAVGLLARADTVLSRPLTDAETTVVSAALGLGAAGAAVRGGTGWLAVVNRRTVRWVATGPPSAPRPAPPPGSASASSASPAGSRSWRPGRSPAPPRGSAPPADVG
jgi:hypothetical protein